MREAAVVAELASLALGPSAAHLSTPLVDVGRADDLLLGLGCRAREGFVLILGSMGLLLPCRRHGLPGAARVLDTTLLVQGRLLG